MLSKVELFACKRIHWFLSLCKMLLKLHNAMKCGSRDKRKPVEMFAPEREKINKIKIVWNWFLWIEHDHSLLIKFAVVGASLSLLVVSHFFVFVVRSCFAVAIWFFLWDFFGTTFKIDWTDASFYKHCFSCDLMALHLLPKSIDFSHL